jgi:hypothetical protein
MGISHSSLAGNGAMITREPDSPINLVNNNLISSAIRIGFLWDYGLENGG